MKKSLKYLVKIINQKLFSIKSYMSIEILFFIIIILFFYVKRQENYKCYHRQYQNHANPLPNHSKKQNLDNIPRRDYIHRLHPYLHIVKSLDKLFPPNNPLIIEKWNGKKIKNQVDDINATRDYIIKQFEKRFQTAFFLIDTTNYISYKIIDKYNIHFNKNYTIYDLVIQEDMKNDYFVLNVHITNKDVIKIQFMTHQTTDSTQLMPAYTGDTEHVANFRDEYLDK